ncbi:MAG: hypothetical protein HKN03_16920 [Acidimicrobiales bacterium]|nr:hypothetical protein [Acidimicrobiia bacterium]NNF56112.1 hypothetical protein [Acidimicrobiales bacterium]
MSERWASLLASHRAVREPQRVAAPEHKPVAAILACSDARVPPSLLFDQPAGSIFVVRVAGNTATPAAIASLDYAVEELAVPLLIVLGHTGCGAVTAARSGKCHGYLSPITQQICELDNQTHAATLDQLIELNVLSAVTTLTNSLSPTGEGIRSGAVEVHGAVYDLSTDLVRPVQSAVTAAPS